MDSPHDVIDLSANRTQVIHSFIWVVIGLVLGLAFILITVFAQDPSTPVIVFGTVLVVISLASAILEFRELPGAVVSFDDGIVQIAPRRGPVEHYPFESIRAIAYGPGPFTDLDGGIRRKPEKKTDTASVIFDRRQQRGIRRPHWYLELDVNNAGLRQGLHGTRLPVGGDRAIFELMAQRCRAHQIEFRKYTH